MDWRQIWDVISVPDNIPITLIAILVPFYAWYAWRQARANDLLITELEANPELAKTHHRKAFPFRPGWARELPVWPYLLRIEFLGAIVVSLILMVWSITLNAPLEEPSNPNHTMNPAKAPWYFVGLQEMLVYFDPWFAGVVLPSLIIVGLMVFPYIDTNPLGVGYYTIKQRSVAVGSYALGFFVWLALIFIGTFVRGPGWMWFWPGQTWDHAQVIYEVNRNLPDVLGITNPWVAAIMGLIAVGAFFVGSFYGIHWLVTRTAFDKKLFERTSMTQYLIFQVFAIMVLVGLPAKMVLRLVFRIHYVLITPWLNI